ncbi:MAG: thermonuclease family protein [Pseudomonadota bacterium]
MLAAFAATFIYGRETYSLARSVYLGGDGCRVTSVTDGDTVRLHCGGIRLIKARLTGFDAPEVYSPKCFSEFWSGTKATWALRWRIWTADEVKVVLTGSDRYGRHLASMFIDGRSASQIMTEIDLARHYSGGRREGWC